MIKEVKHMVMIYNDEYIAAFVPARCSMDIKMWKMITWDAYKRERCINGQTDYITLCLPRSSSSPLL